MKQLALIAALMLSSCGEKALTLPDNPIDRAATCGVVAAASARSSSGDIEAKLGFDQQGAIMHPALLEGATGSEFQNDRTAAAVARMSQLEAEITSNKWDALVAPCAAAYPATQVEDEIKLPADTLEAQLGCDALSDFLSTALRPQEHDYVEELRAYTEMERKLDMRIGSIQSRRGATDFGDNQDARQRALASVVKLGPPMSVMKVCVERFG